MRMGATLFSSLIHPLQLATSRAMSEGTWLGLAAIDKVDGNGFPQRGAVRYAASLPNLLAQSHMLCSNHSQLQAQGTAIASSECHPVWHFASI